MKKKLQVFVSSTYTDLLKERQSAVEAILRAGHIPAGMELFSAGNKSQLDTIKKWIEESDIYMIILGGRYGSLEPYSKLSYTEIEYKYAMELDKPLFGVIISDSMLDEKIKIDGKGVLELENQDKYKQFKDIVLSKTCRFANSEAEIKLSILESIIDIQNTHTLYGWVKGDEIPDNTEFLNEIKILRNQRDELQLKVVDLEVLTKKTSKSNNIGEYNFDELYKVLNSKKIVFPASLNKEGKEIETNALQLLLSYSSNLTIGVTSSMANDVTRFLLNKLIPLLLNFGLIERINMKSRDFQYDKFVISSLGNRFISMIELKKVKIDK